MSNHSKFSEFLKTNEKKVIFFFIVLLFLILDFSFSLISNSFNLSLFCKNRLLESVASKHPVFHHGFLPNTSGKGYGFEKVFTKPDRDPYCRSIIIRHTNYQIFRSFNPSLRPCFSINSSKVLTSFAK